VSRAGGVSLSVCTECESTFFPHRLLCPRCGGGSWTALCVTEGTVEEVTTVHRAIGSHGDPVVLATVRLKTGQRIIASLPEVAPRDSRVTLTQREGAVCALLQRP
jgi:uncharacterized OB-fold protein